MDGSLIRATLGGILIALLVSGCAPKATLSYHDQVMKTLKQRMKVMRECYATALVDDPGLEGRIAVRFTINDEGAVLSAWVPEDSALQPTSGMDPEQAEKQRTFLAMEPLPDQVQSCILSVVETTTFPPPAEVEEPTFVYPMTFKPD